MNEKKSKIQNVEFKNTYQKFLEYLVEVENISNENYQKHATKKQEHSYRKNM